MDSSSKKTLAFCVVLLLLVAGAAALVKYGPWGKSPPAADGKDRDHEPVTPFVADQVVRVPFIFWGGDAATFHANGGLETQPDSVFGKLGLKLSLTPGD